MLRVTIAEWAEQDGVELNPRSLDGVEQAQRDGIMDMFKQRGIPGLSRTGEPTAASSHADPLRPSAPPRHLLSSLLRHAADSKCEELCRGASADDRIRLLSAAGPTAGTCFAAHLSFEGVHFSDRSWTTAVKFRLGVGQPGPQLHCANTTAAGELCNKVLCEHADHAVECPCGPLRNQRHDNLAYIYADIFEEVGGIARRELFVPELSGKREAWLDVWALGIQELPDPLLDVSVRHPRAPRYRPGSEQRPGAAASKAEEVKRDRYPAKAGREVWPIVHETWGRLGEEAEALLHACAAAAARRAHRRGRTAGGELRRWRAKLDGALQRAVAAQLNAARHGLPGRPRRKQQPWDLAVLECRPDS